MLYSIDFWVQASDDSWPVAASAKIVLIGLQPVLATAGKGPQVAEVATPHCRRNLLMR